MKKFDEIYNYLNKRKKLLNKFHKAEAELAKIENHIKEHENPFLNCEVNVNKYRDFFKQYDISLNDKEKYEIKEIKMTKDYQGNPFYDVVFEYVRTDDSGIEIERNQSLLSLRKVLHLFDYTETKFVEKEKK